MRLQTNATMVTFVTKQRAASGVDSMEALGGLSARVENWQLWVTAIAVEHGVILARVLILIIIPAAPRWVEEVRAI